MSPFKRTRKRTLYPPAEVLFKFISVIKNTPHFENRTGCALQRYQTFRLTEKRLSEMRGEFFYRFFAEITLVVEKTESENANRLEEILMPRLTQSVIWNYKRALK